MLSGAGSAVRKIGEALLLRPKGTPSCVRTAWLIVDEGSCCAIECATDTGECAYAAVQSGAGEPVIQ